MQAAHAQRSAELDDRTKLLDAREAALKARVDAVQRAMSTA